MSEGKYTLQIAPQVARDLHEIEFYKKKYNTYPENIANLISEIRQEIRRLERSPFASSSLNNKTQVPTNYRYSAVNEYLIFFEIIGDKVNVYRVLSGKMDYLNILGLS